MLDRNSASKHHMIDVFVAKQMTPLSVQFDNTRSAIALAIIISRLDSSTGSLRDDVRGESDPRASGNWRTRLRNGHVSDF